MNDIFFEKAKFLVVEIYNILHKKKVLYNSKQDPSRKLSSSIQQYSSPMSESNLGGLGNGATFTSSDAVVSLSHQSPQSGSPPEPLHSDSIRSPISTRAAALAAATCMSFLEQDSGRGSAPAEAGKLRVAKLPFK